MCSRSNRASGTEFVGLWVLGDVVLDFQEQPLNEIPT